MSYNNITRCSSRQSLTVVILASPSDVARSRCACRHRARIWYTTALAGAARAIVALFTPARRSAAMTWIDGDSDGDGDVDSDVMVMFAVVVTGRV